MSHIEGKSVITSRVFPYPRSLVFRAWSESEHIARWWGPLGFTNTFHQFEFKVGAKPRFTMHGPDGKDWENELEYMEIKPGQRIVVRHPHPDFEIDARFEDAGEGKTRLTWSQTFDDAAVLEAMKHICLPANEQNMDRLEAELARMTDLKPFVLNEVVDAPREKVWKAWTDRAELMKWFGPKGFPMTEAKLDFRPGGSFLYGLRSPDGMEFWGKWIFRDIQPGEKIVLLNHFSDKDGGITRHPMNAEWPREMLSITTFEDASPGKTKISVEWVPWHPTETEKKVFASSFESMKQGWGGTFEQLRAYLK